MELNEVGGSQHVQPPVMSQIGWSAGTNWHKVKPSAVYCRSAREITALGLQPAQLRGRCPFRGWARRSAAGPCGTARDCSMPAALNSTRHHALLHLVLAAATCSSCSSSTLSLLHSMAPPVTAGPAALPDAGGSCHSGTGAGVSRRAGGPGMQHVRGRHRPRRPGMRQHHRLRLRLLLLQPHLGRGQHPEDVRLHH
jgi:hypothetical protein